jgi:hypothetical protein
MVSLHADTLIAGRDLLGEFFDPMDPQLMDLIPGLMDSRVHAWAPSTLAGHATAWSDFVVWVNNLQQRHDIFHVPGELVGLYLSGIRDESAHDGIGPSRVLKASAAIACHYAANGHASPTSHPLCQLVRTIASRTLHGKMVPRDVIELSDMRLLLDAFGNEHSSLMDIMHVTSLLLMFAGCLRFDDMAEVSVHVDLMVFHEGYVELFLIKSKTDQCLKGRWVVIAASNSGYCPVLRLQNLLAKGKYKRTPISADEDVGPLLRPVRYTAEGHVLKNLVGTLINPVNSLSYTRLLEHCQEMCRFVGLDKAIGLHSFRIGGITAAADSGVPSSMLRRLGNWKSEAMPRLYTRSSLQSLLHAARAMSL